MRLSMALPLSIIGFSERGDQWRRYEKHWRDTLEEALGSSGSLSPDREEVEELLRDFRIEGVAQGSDRHANIVEALSPAIARLVPFVKTLNAVSQSREVSALVWLGLLSVVESASKSRVVPSKAIKLVTELCQSIPSVEQVDDAIYKFKHVQHVLQDLFEDYMTFCIQVSTYFSRPVYERNIENVYSRGPRSMLDLTKHRFSRHVRNLGDAVELELQRLKTLQASKIAELIPAGLSDMPRDATHTSTESTIEFPVSTVNRVRNSAFVGREGLMGDIAHNINKPIRHTQQRSGASSNLANTPSESTTRGDSLRDPPSSNLQSESITENQRSKTSDVSPVVCVLHGLGGVGKTGLVIEYYYDHRSEYDACFWIESESDWNLSNSFSKISDKLDLLTKKTMDTGGDAVTSKAVEASRNWLQTTDKRWLLIFDNVEDFGDLVTYIPSGSCSDGTILITTQKPNIPAWLQNTRILHVEPLDRETAATCLFQYLDRAAKDEEEHQVACDLADWVGCLPLAMATIGGYVKQSETTLAEFFRDIKRKATLWKKASKVQETQGYSKNLVTVFDQAFTDLTAPSRELLNVLAFLEPDYIPEEIFTTAIKNKRFKHIHDKHDLIECYFELRSRQLIRRDTSTSDPYVCIHRIVQWNTLLDLSNEPDNRWVYFRQAFDIVQDLLPKTSPLAMPEPEVWPPYARHGRQILELRTHCLWPEPPVELPRDFAQILADMGTYMWFSGKFPEGEEALTTAEKILDHSGTKMNDPLRASIYALLGVITSFEGVSERKRSMELRRNALRSRGSDIGLKSENQRTREEDMLVWNVHSDMAYGFIQEEDFESTAKYMEECLEQYQKWESEPMAIPFEYAKYHQLIAFCHMADKKPVDAVNAITRCYELIQEAAGVEHPFSQLIKFCHANLLWHTNSGNMRQEALRVNKAVLEWRRRLLGEFSHFTLESYSTCGKLCHEAGENELAKDYLGNCLQRRKRAVWNEEGITRAQFRYSKVLRYLAQEAQHNNKEAEAAAYDEDAEEKEALVKKTIERYRRDYADYMPLDETASEEENLDQMVSFWSGRYTGRLKQGALDISFLQGADPPEPANRKRKRSD